MSTTQALIATYGPLMTIGDLATLLRRSPEGLRFTMRGRSDLARKLADARVRVGRRIHFHTDSIAALIDVGASTDAAPEAAAAGRKHG